MVFAALDVADHVVAWDLKTGVPRYVCNEHDSTVVDLEVSPCGTYVASVSNDRSMLVYNTRTMVETQVSTGLKGEPMSLLMGPRGISACVADSLGVVRTCNLRAGKRVVDVLRSFQPAPILDAALSHTGRYLAVSRSDGLRVYNLLPTEVPPQLAAPH